MELEWRRGDPALPCRHEATPARPADPGASGPGPREGSMRRIAAALAGLAAAVALAFAVLVGFMRLSQGRFEPPVQVAPGVVGVKGAAAWFYAARLGRGVVLFDAGYDGRARPADAALAALGASRADVTDVFLTHGHPDHVGAVAAFPAARVHAGAGDVELAAGRERSPHALQRMVQAFVPAAGARVTDPLSVEATIDVGGAPVLAIPVPGHTAGSTAYLAGGVLYAGDVVSYESGRLAPPPRFFSRDPGANDRAVAALARRLSGEPVETICTGHGGCSPPGRAKALLDAFAAGVAGRR